MADGRAEFNRSVMDSIATYALIALLFEIAVVGVSIIAAIFIVSFSTLAAGILHSSILSVVLLAIYLVFLLINVLTLIRTLNIRNAARAQDANRLRKLNSNNLGISVTALVLCGVIPGIMLLLAGSDIDCLIKGVAK